MGKLKFVLIAFILWRVLLFIPLFAGHEWLPYREGYAYSNIWKFTQEYSPVDNFLIYPWANFDGVHYLSIAGNGYELNGRFMPLFPILTRVFSFLFGVGEPFGWQQFFSGLILSNTLFIFSLILLYKLVLLDHNEKVAKQSIIFLLLFPTSFFFAGIYSESLFLFLSLLAFYFARKKQWLFSGIAGGLLGATRIVGILIFPALFYQFQKIKASPFKALPLFLTFFGFIGYGLYSLAKWHDFLYFVRAHSEIANNRSFGLVFPPQTVIRYFKMLTTVSPSQFEFWVALLEVFTFFIVSGLLYLAWKKGVNKEYLIFSILTFLVPVFSGTFSSLPRYSLVLFPIFITLAVLDNKVIKIAYSIISILLLFLLLMYFSRGYFVS